ncbi:MAG: lysophospholipid acyltransferase family protein [bacterium]
MQRLIRFLFFLLIVKPLLLIVLGINIRYRERLPNSGPAIICANHNSHLDTLVLITLFSCKIFNSIRPVAARDYFCCSPFLSWFSKYIMQIIPLDRKFGTYHADPFKEISESLDNNEVVIIYPEGSRGEPERLSQFKNGIYHLAKKHPQVPIVPIFMHGLGKALPRNEWLLVPFFCDVFVGEILHFVEDRKDFMHTLEESIQRLGAEGQFKEWY